MGRTNLALLAIGLGAALLLSMTMQRLLEIKKDHVGGKVAKEVDRNYGRRLAAAASLEVEQRDGRNVAILTILPQLPSAGPRLARDIGRFTWSFHKPGDWQDLVVRVRRHQGDTGHEYPIEQPFRSRSSSATSRRPPKKTLKKTRTRPTPGR